MTDTIPQDPTNTPSNLKVVSVAPLIAHAIKAIHSSQSISTLFE